MYPLPGIGCLRAGYAKRQRLATARTLSVLVNTFFSAPKRRILSTFQMVKCWEPSLLPGLYPHTGNLVRDVTLRRPSTVKSVSDRNLVTAGIQLLKRFWPPPPQERDDGQTDVRFLTPDGEPSIPSSLHPEIYSPTLWHGR